MDNSLPIIAGTYRIMGKIGSGGGGIVYLAEHLRLNKKVVLKADKRTFSIKPESVRREVDALKGLSHAYIPQVYDFIEENGTFYTVMDYVEGESFDKPLERGERFSQAQIVEWACQLLEALACLHNSPPHGILHADIKPANVMLTPQGDIRLIDFNIALALGEEGAVAIGASSGYSSPEHYGLDYSSGSTRKNMAPTVKKTVALPGQQPQTRKLGGDESKPKTTMLNARSDIYGLGATLYHMMTGERPAEDATEVKPISTRQFSPAVVGIISKAMHPNQDLRWQTAGEMLHAFEHLRENDPRSKRHRRISALLAALLSFMFLAGGATIFAGQRLIAEESKKRELLAKARAMAGDSADSLRAGDVKAAIDYALQALSIYSPPIAEAQKALADALGVYDLSDGYKPHLSIEIPGEVLKFAVSPNEKFAAAMTLGRLVLFEPETGEKIAELPTVDSALADVVFVGNETIVYAGLEGIAMYDIPGRRAVWSGKPATTISVSADRSRIAAVFRDEEFATVYGINGDHIQTVPFDGRHLRVVFNDRLADPRDNLFALNSDGTLLGASFSNGSLKIFDLAKNNGNINIFDESDYTHFEGGFNGKYFVFSATNSDESLFYAIDLEILKVTDEFEGPERIGVSADESGIYITFRNKSTKYNPETLEETDPDHGRNPPLYIFDHSMDSPEIKISKLESNADKDIFSYDSFYDHSEARISGDGKTVMLFSKYGFRLHKIGGETITEVSLENKDRIYDQQYRRVDGRSYLEVIWYDGTVRKYSAVDGAMFSEERTDPPSEDLYEEFFTDKFKIMSNLHGTPTVHVHDLESGEKICELERDAYLTYATQAGEHIVTEYISITDGERFGLLLNERFETLAYLPNLCDVIGDELVFDLKTGKLRKIRIYHIDELIALAK